MNVEVGINLMVGSPKLCIARMEYDADLLVIQAPCFYFNVFALHTIVLYRSTLTMLLIIIDRIGL